MDGVALQGVVKSYDPISGDGTVMCDTGGLTEYELSRSALDGSIFRMLRQGQRVVFDLDERALAVRIRHGLRGRHGHPGLPAGPPRQRSAPPGRHRHLSERPSPRGVTGFTRRRAGPRGGPTA